MDPATILASLEFIRARLLGSITAIEQSGQDVAKVLAWRPGPGRAHIGWQLMHCAATHDKYLHLMLLGGQPKDPALVSAFGGGSTPSDQNIPNLETIRRKLEATFSDFRDYVAGLNSTDLERLNGPEGKQQTIAQRLMVMIWHESHHQGQIHLTWNLYKAAHGVA
jgi:uncharacterized damage-inducible protein DinB